MALAASSVLIVLEIILFCQADETGVKPKALGWSTSDWSYADGNWGGVCKDGIKQSPIQLSLEYAFNSSTLKSDPFHFKNYEKWFEGTLENDGRTVFWNISEVDDKNTLPSISGGGLGSSYVLNTILFHWGSEKISESCKGAEHVVEYSSSPMEVQFVHHNAKYPSLQNASGEDKGLAIVSFLFKPVNKNLTEASGYSDLISNKLAGLSDPGSKMSTKLSLTHLFPVEVLNNEAVYFRYEGSLTAPPCSETVTWTVFRDPIEIPQEKLRNFRTSIYGTKFVDNRRQLVSNNYRNIQTRHDRMVWTNGPGLAKMSVASIQQHCEYVSVFAILITIMNF